MRANPMAWVLRAGSPLLGPLNTAIITTLVNNTWHGPKVALEAAWFPKGSSVPIGSPSTLNVKTLAAAGALVLAWLLCLALEKLWDVPRVQRALQRVLPARCFEPPQEDGAAATEAVKAAGGDGDNAAACSRAAVAAARAAASAAVEAADRAEALLARAESMASAPAQSPELRRRIATELDTHVV